MRDADGADIPRMVDRVCGRRRGVRPHHRPRRGLPNGARIAHVHTGRASPMGLLTVDGSRRASRGADTASAGERRLGGMRRDDDEPAGPGDRRLNGRRRRNDLLGRRRSFRRLRDRLVDRRLGGLYRRAGGQESKRVDVALLVRGQA
jgi:hypothetical protein